MKAAERSLAEQEEALPGLSKMYEETKKQTEETNALLHKEIENYTKVSEKAERAMNVFQEIRKAEQAISSASSAARQAENIASEARQNVSRLEENEQKWRSQAETLGQAGLLLERWQGEMNRMAEMEADLFSIRTLALEMNKQKQAADKARQEYADASRIYEQKNKEYENSRRIFLNAQAGFIAKEQLRPGQPCPVCGSLHHPRPCQLEDDHQNLSRDELDVLGEEVNSLRSRQEDTASASRSAAALFQEKENTLTGEMEKLQRKLAENVPEGAEIPEKTDDRAGRKNSAGAETVSFSERKRTERGCTDSETAAEPSAGNRDRKIETSDCGRDSGSETDGGKGVIRLMSGPAGQSGCLPGV